MKVLIPSTLIAHNIANIQFPTFKIQGLQRNDLLIAQVHSEEFTVIVESRPNVWNQVGDIPSLYNDPTAPRVSWGGRHLPDTDTLEQWADKCREYFQTFVVAYDTKPPVRKPNPNESFAIKSLTREQIAKNLTSIVNDENIDIALFEKDDDRLTSDICQELATDFRFVDEDSEEDTYMEEQRLCRKLIYKHFAPKSS